MRTGIVQPLWQIRVLLVTKDRRFARVAQFLLSRNGFTVETVGKGRDLLDLIVPYGAHIVIIDSSNSLSETARMLGALEALHPAVGVVLVGDTSREAALRLDVIPKWSGFHRLVDEVRHVYANGLREAQTAATAADA